MVLDDPLVIQDKSAGVVYTFVQLRLPLRLFKVNTRSEIIPGIYAATRTRNNLSNFDMDVMPSGMLCKRLSASSQ